MATLKVTLGKKWGDEVVIETTIDTVDVNPDDIFVACNRIEVQSKDVANLSMEWQRELRRLIDATDAPSMSSQDEAEFYSDEGHYIGKYICLPRGWEAHHLLLGDKS